VTLSPAKSRVFKSVNPATEQVVGEHREMTSAEVEHALGRAQSAFLINSRQPVSWRAERLQELAKRLREEHEDLARLMSAEMGKPLKEAEAEVEKCAVSCQHYALHAEEFLRDEPTPADSPRSFVAFRPLGVVLAIMPWNFPLWQVVRFLAPGLMAGNTGLLKHAPNTFGCALALERLVAEAGFPPGSLTALITGIEPVPDLISDSRIRAVTLTGSDTAGSQVAALAGRELKKTVLELGGSDFFLVLADADLSAAAEVGVRSRFQNCGQSCIAAKRFLVAEAVAEEFEERFIALAQKLTVGDPLDPDVSLGPMARNDLRERLHDQLERSLKLGAQLKLGGAPAESPGFFYPATVVTGATPEMAVFQEETFGPVAAFTRFSGEAEGIRLANHPRYGLGGNIWTRDQQRGVRLAAEMDTGGVFVNGMTHSDSRMPFGGVRRSGYGRELASFGMREFTNVQTVWQP
jgi:succinate-semialdehyde dehydrogenase/glutarate-semialdehyde dehydrogenase